MSDSVPISRRRPAREEDSDSEDEDAATRATPRIRVANYKLMLALFFIFLIVVSDVFTNSIISQFGSAVEGRDPTSWGVVLQGIFLVLGYILAVYLTEHGVL